MNDGQGTVPPSGMVRAETPDCHAPGKNTARRVRRFTRRTVERARIAPGCEVVSRDLETVGSVRELIFDPEGGMLIGIVVEEGSRLGGAQELSCAVLGWLDEGAIYLSVTIDDLLGGHATGGEVREAAG